MVTLLLIAMSLGAQLTNEGFVYYGEEHGVATYRHDRHDGFELAADGWLPATPERVLRVLTDYANHPRWVKGLSESRIVGSGPGWLNVYQRLHLPPLDDRDFTLHVTWAVEGDTRVLRFAAANEAGPPPVHGVVRVSVHEGEWHLTAADGGTRAVYRFHLDLGGSFPTWMGRGGAVKSLFSFFERVRDQLQYYP